MTRCLYGALQAGRVEGPKVGDPAGPGPRPYGWVAEGRLNPGGPRDRFGDRLGVDFDMDADVRAMMGLAGGGAREVRRAADGVRAIRREAAANRDRPAAAGAARQA